MNLYTVTESAKSSVENQLSLIGYMKLANVRRYLLESLHISVNHYADCLNTIEPALFRILDSVDSRATEAAMDFILYSLDWK